MIGNNFEVFWMGSDDTFYSALYNIIKLGTHIADALMLINWTYNEVTQTDCEIVFIRGSDLKLMKGICDITAGGSKTKIASADLVEITVKNIKVIENC